MGGHVQHCTGSEASPHTAGYCRGKSVCVWGGGGSRWDQRTLPKSEGEGLYNRQREGERSRRKEGQRVRGGAVEKANRKGSTGEREGGRGLMKATAEQRQSENLPIC